MCVCMYVIQRRHDGYLVAFSFQSAELLVRGDLPEGIDHKKNTNFKDVETKNNCHISTLKMFSTSFHDRRATVLPTASFTKRGKRRMFLRNVDFV